MQTAQSSHHVITHRYGGCRLCGSPLTRSVADLGMSPLCESFVAPADLDTPESVYPLHVFVCDICLLVQLKEYVSPQEIFGEYAYFSSYSTSWVDHARDYVQMIASRLGLGSGSLVVEAASNDGYLLQHFTPLGIPVLGVEPAANVARAASEKGIPTRVAFFGRSLSSVLAREVGRADLIIGNNVLAQVPDLHDFVGGMRDLLKPEGMITLEFPHVLQLITQNQFDTIYHEHFSYFSLFSIESLATRHALRVVDVEELPTHGGSLRVYIAHAGSQWPTAPRVSALLDKERSLGFHNTAVYVAFAEQVRATKRALLSCLISLKDAGKTICGYGAPGKGNTLLNYCGIGPDFLDFTVDRNPYKHGRHTPGTRIPIHPVEAIDRARPDYLLILPWNLTREIAGQMRHIGDWGGKFVVPIPRAKIIDPTEVTL
ncbi:MAG: class I SAM-dependent methyltransferase [Proteobacteria bacterium]|nr:class I SAM-dependent methyltransferase [Pseudomonadota bacterium]